MVVTEPMTMVTDYILSLMSLAIAISLARNSARRGGRRVRVWVTAFTVIAVAALAGGTAHGFRVPLGESWSLVWRVTVWAIGIGAVLLIAAGIGSVRDSEASSPPLRRRGVSWVKRAIAASLLGLAVLVVKLSLHPHFNQNDLYHVIQMFGLYCLYRGAVLLHGLEESKRVPDSD
jgi:MFS family permease